MLKKNKTVYKLRSEFHFVAEFLLEGWIIFIFEARMWMSPFDRILGNIFGWRQTSFRY